MDKRRGVNWVEIGLGAAAVIIAVVAFTPSELNERIALWRDQFGIYILAAGALVVGIIVGRVSARLLARRQAGPSAAAPEGQSLLLTNDEFEVRVHELLKVDAQTVVKVFGYTGETALNDVFRFDDRYRGTLDVRFLHRNWLDEAADEDAHNASYSYLRPWAKSRSIANLGLEQWNHPLRRQFRYYRHHPMVKGILITRPRSEWRCAFLTFFEWVERPTEGGSPIKGIGLPFVYVEGGTNSADRFLDLLESQFDYEWSNGSSAEEISAKPE